MAYRASVINTPIQRGTITITNGSGATGTATITAVDPANSRLKYLGQVSNTAAVETPVGYLTFTNSTTITATMQGSRVGDNIFAFEVVPYYTGVINSIQRNTITLTGTDATKALTINAVNTSKAEVDILGYSYSQTSQNWTEFSIDAVLTNATTVTATRIGTTGIIVAMIQVIEWR